MRPILVLAALLASSAQAEDVRLPSHVTASVLFPDGASVTREVRFDLPPGDHTITVADLPPSVPLDQMRVSVEGATLGAVSLRGEQLLPNEAPETDAIRAARAEVDRLKQALTDLEHQRQEILLAEAAARAQLGFLDKLPLEGAVQDAGSLRDMATMIGETALAAETQALTARREAAALGRLRDDLQNDLEDAQQALAALLQPKGDRAFAVIAVQADAPATGVVRMVYPLSRAGWVPQYDFHLTRPEGGAQLRIEEGALLYQDSGERWEGAQITLSTTRPSERSEPSQLSPWMPRIIDPDTPRPYAGSMRSAAPEAKTDTMHEAVKAALEIAETRSFSGIRIERDLAVPVDLPSGAGQLRVSVAEQTLDAALFARAALPWDDVAYAMAEVTLPGDAVLLPAQAGFYFDEGYVGQRRIDHLTGGEEVELAFGPVEGIEITRRELERLEGDAGVISRQNTEESRTAYTITNRTRDAWDLRLSARVPVSSQEDLRVDWDSAPRPDVTDPEGKRGVLEWHRQLVPGAGDEITLGYTLRWPREQILQR